MVIIAILLGWISGALINYVADVLPLRRKLVRPFCTACERPQPLINYLIWPRKCPDCAHSRSRRSWAVELIVILIAIWLSIQPDLALGFWISMVLVIYFGIVVVIDLEHHLIMHPVSVVGGALSIAIGVYRHGIVDTLLGGLAGFGTMFALYILGALFARYIVRRRQREFNDEALGFGDVILGGILGLLLGWPAILAGLFLSIILAGVVSLVYLILTIITRRYQAFTFIPYGPFMIAGAVALIFFGRYFANSIGA